MPPLLVLAALAAAGVASAGQCEAEDGPHGATSSSLLQSKTLRRSEDLPSEEHGTAQEARQKPGFTIYLFNSKMSRQKDKSALVVRPLFKKTYRCRTQSPFSCDECTSRSGPPGRELGKLCFHTRRDTSRSEFLELQPKAGGRWRPWQHHRIKVNFHCPEVAQFTVAAAVRIKGLDNTVYMKVDGDEVHPEDRPLRGGRKHMKFKTLWNTEKGRVVDLELHFVMRRGGWAKVNHIRIVVDSEYLTCADHKACLSILERTAGGPALRNDNVQQLRCLDGKLPADDACAQWKACLDASNTTSRIRRLLLATGVDNSSRYAAPDPLEAVGEEGSSEIAAEPEAASEAGNSHPAVPTLLEAQDEESCLNPTIDDPESWLCSCLDRMEETCFAISNAFPPDQWSFQKCLTAQMCVDPMGKVCSAWKADVGCDGTEYAELKRALIDYISGAGPTLAPTPSPTLALAATPTAAPDPAAALHERAQGAGGARKQAQLMDTSLGGKASACN